jgi:hypothetical protein
MNAQEASAAVGWEEGDVFVYQAQDDVTVGSSEVKFVFGDDQDRLLAVAYGWGSSGPWLDIRAFVDGEQIDLDVISLGDLVTVRPKID